MKKLLLLTLGLFVTQTQAYDIWVRNTTDEQIHVGIENHDGPICATPNRGDYLAPHKEDSWPTHNVCQNQVYIRYPNNSFATINASAGHHAFEVYKNEKGEYHWRNY